MALMTAARVLEVTGVGLKEDDAVLSYAGTAPAVQEENR
jgi:hypothetical protein